MAFFKSGGLELATELCFRLKPVFRGEVDGDKSLIDTRELRWLKEDGGASEEGEIGGCSEPSSGSESNEATLTTDWR
jgi:hypothetical protein